MTTYKAADGHNIVLGSLIDLDPQPATVGIQSTRRVHSGSGSVLDEGKYIELKWNTLGTVAQYQAILTALGISSALTNEITIYVQDETFAWVRMNGTAVRPEQGRGVQRRMPFVYNITILVKDLVAAS